MWQNNSSTVLTRLRYQTNHYDAVPVIMLPIVGIIVAAIVALFQVTRLTLKYSCILRIISCCCGIIARMVCMSFAFEDPLMSFAPRLKTLDQSASGVGLGEVSFRGWLSGSGWGSGSVRARVRLRVADQQVLPDLVSAGKNVKCTSIRSLVPNLCKSKPTDFFTGLFAWFLNCFWRHCLRKHVAYFACRRALRPLIINWPSCYYTKDKPSRYNFFQRPFFQKRETCTFKWLDHKLSQSREKSHMLSPHDDWPSLGCQWDVEYGDASTVLAQILFHLDGSILAKAVAIDTPTLL